MVSVQSSRAAASCLLLLAVCTLSSLPRASAVEFDMVFQTKCIFEEVVDETSVVSGAFEAFIRDKPNDKVPVNLRIENPLGELVFEKKESAGVPFSISEPIEGEYRLCFTTKDYHTAQKTRISFKWREGIEAKDWSSVAKKDNLDTVHTELLRLEDAVHNIHLELQHIRRKEEQMRDVNEATNSRVAWASLGALVTCVAMAMVQIWNLKKFFVRKKLL